LSQHKTGSRMLCDMIASHPGLSCPHEYLDTPRHNADWRASLDLLESETGRKAIGHVQAKSVTMDMLTDENTKRLLLVRDPYASALSRLRVEFEQLGAWTLDPRRYRAEVNFRTAENERLLPFTDGTVSYEEITGCEHASQAPDAVAAFLCAFFGVSTMPLKTLVRKSTPSFPSNWRELI